MRKWMSLVIVAAALGTTLAQEPSQAPAATHMLVAPVEIQWDELHHYAIAITEATVQVHGTGPFQLTYVNPADTPKPRGGAK